MFKRHLQVKFAKDHETTSDASSITKEDILEILERTGIIIAGVIVASKVTSMCCRMIEHGLGIPIK